jgi:hypothetical protein
MRRLLRGVGSHSKAECDVDNSSDSKPADFSRSLQENKGNSMFVLLNRTARRKLEQDITRS